jgi:signal transduction histidine kinase/DNA-binding response OmpR family regulator
MRFHFYILVICFVLGFSKSHSYGQALDYTAHLSISNGLAHNGVTSIIQSRNGLVWLGTYDGLNLYDGYDLRTFKNRNGKSILKSNRIRSLAEDEKGNIWIGTDEGISIYNYNNNDFRDLYLKDKIGAEGGPIVLDILIDEGRVLCGTESEGIIVFDDQQQFIGQYTPSLSSNVPPPVFNGTLKLSNKDYLCATSNGLFVFNIQNGEFNKVLGGEIDFSNFVISLDNNFLLIGMRTGVGLISYDSKAGEKVFNLKRKNFEDKIFNSASLDVRGHLWLGSLYNGIIKVKNINNFITGDDFSFLTWERDTPGTRGSLVYTSSNSGCWVGTFTHGIFRFDLDESPFFYYNSSMGLNHGVKSNEVLQMSVFDEDRVFISTHRGGSGLFNTKNNLFEPLPFDLPDGVDPVSITSVFVDSHKNIWLRIPGALGLGVVKNGTRYIKKVDPSFFPQFNQIAPKKIYEDSRGNLWFGTQNDLYKVVLNDVHEIQKIESINNNAGIKFEKISPVFAIYEDPEYNYIWVGTMKDGLLRIENGANGSLINAKIYQCQFVNNEPLSLSSNFVTSIARVTNTQLWVGTEGGGIFKVLDSNGDPRFVSFSEKDGLSNNVVKAIVFDDKNNLWIPTNIGLNRIDPRKLDVKNYHEEDGLPFEDFTYSTAQLENGNFVFSGLDGFFYFDPENIPDKEPLPDLTFGDLKMFNETVFPGDTVNGRVLLTKRLNNLSELDLRYNENVFSIEVKSIHFSTPENHYIKYKLDPVSPEWIKVVSDQKYINFTGLKPGEYKFSVMASNSFNKWTPPRQITIKIAPPFWETGWAYGIYILVFLAIIFVIIIIVLRIQNLKHNLEIEHVEREKVQEINDEKLRFFVNISHEIKTPLTLIGGTFSFISEHFRGNTTLQNQLFMVKRQLKRMNQLVEQVQDFHKSENQRLRLSYSTFLFDDFLTDVIKDFEFIASQEGKNLKIDRKDGSETWVKADRDKIEKILSNILNNAFKFTSEGDGISVSYIKKNDELLIVISDTGQGISSEDISFVFDRFFQSTSSPKHQNIGGSGIGLAFTRRLVEMHYGFISVESEVGKGTSFSIRLPILSEDGELNKEQKIEQILDIEKHSSIDYLALRNDPSLSVSPEFKNSKVFLAEDNADMRKFISDILSEFFIVELFSDGEKCLQALNDEWPDIIVSDVLMPNINGFELCDKIKSDIKTCHIPVILLTACTDIEDQIKGIKGGADSYIGKPFNIEHLVASIESLLQGRKQLRERFQMDFPLTLDKENDTGKDHAFLEKLYQLISENIDNQDLDINIFARELYLNRTHFYQKVKAITGFTPFELLKAFRLKKAADLLVNGDVPVAEVSMMTGFKSRTHFSKIFKEKYSVTPGKYADEMKKKLSAE